MPLESYQIPALLLIFCVMSAMAFVVAGTQWMWRAYTAPQREGVVIRDYKCAVFEGQQHSFVVVVVLSLFVGLYDFVFSDEPLRITGEVVTLVLGAFFLYKKASSQSAVKPALYVFSSIVTIIKFGAFCLLGWLLTVGFWVGFSGVLKAVIVANAHDFDVAVVFLTGILWNVPIVYLGYKTLRSRKARSALQGRTVYSFLWPVMFAYFVLMAPLLIQQTANSEEWEEMKHAKKVREI